MVRALVARKYGPRVRVRVAVEARVGVGVGVGVEARPEARVGVEARVGILVISMEPGCSNPRKKIFRPGNGGGDCP